LIFDIFFGREQPLLLVGAFYKISPIGDGFLFNVWLDGEMKYKVV